MWKDNCARKLSSDALSTNFLRVKHLKVFFFLWNFKTRGSPTSHRKMFYCPELISTFPQVFSFQFSSRSYQLNSWIPLLHCFLPHISRIGRETDKRIMAESHETSNIEEEKEEKTMQIFFLLLYDMERFKIAVGRQKANKRVEEFSVQRGQKTEITMARHRFDVRVKADLCFAFCSTSKNLFVLLLFARDSSIIRWRIEASFPLRLIKSYLKRRGGFFMSFFAAQTTCMNVWMDMKAIWIFIVPSFYLHWR